MQATKIIASLVVLAAVLTAQKQSVQGPDTTLQRVASQTVRFATYNASLNRFNAGDLTTALSVPGDPQASAVAEIIQRARPDVVLINEFDYDATGQAVDGFLSNYLGVSQNGATPIRYPHVFLAPSNTGIPSGLDLDNDGSTTGPGDAFGFGFFPGQFGMVLLSRYPIDHDHVRTFQNFLWQDMPGALLPDDPMTPEPADYYTPTELNAFRLSSKSHWDVPVMVNGRRVHVLCAHPTPPVFDGPEDRNGRRNNDEIRFWSDYVTQGSTGYMYDDAGKRGGLPFGSDFVIVGDYNADPVDGDSFPGAIQQLLFNNRVNSLFAPRSGGSVEAGELQGGANAGHVGDALADTADFNDTAPGNLRVDYCLPSVGIPVVASGVFWPLSGDPLSSLIGTGFPIVSSDHRLVWVDARFGNTALEFRGSASFATGTQFQGTELGGLSSIDFDPWSGEFIAICDDRSNINPARWYSFTADISDGFLSDGDVQFWSTMPLRRNDGSLYPAGSLDPEGVAYDTNGEIFISSEGSTNSGIDPFVDRFDVTGRQFDALPVPSKFLVATPGIGVRNNQGFESLALSPLGTSLWAAVENALQQDGPATSLLDRSFCRIIRFDRWTGMPHEEYVYQTEKIPLPSVPTGIFQDNGLVEILPLRGEGFPFDTAFLAMERSFAVGVGNTIRIFAVDLQGADEVSAAPALDTIPSSLIDPVRKELVLDLSVLGIGLDNFEGMTFGPDFPDGRRSLFLISDNNFNSNQSTLILAFAMPSGL